MYWFQSGSSLHLLLYLLLSGGWALGGWLLASHLFQLQRRERLLTGMATGLVLFITLGNLFANLVTFPAALMAASAVLLAGGLAAAFLNRRKTPGLPFLDLSDLRAWPQLVVLGGLTLLFTMIGRGLALFDDYLHLPLVSAMAAGDVPPHFYLNPSMNFAYHYGLQVLAASMVRLGGFLPWSAWDASKALAIALTLMLGWLWFLRLTGSRTAAALGTFFLSFAGGARWLLLLLPPSLLLRVSAVVNMTNTGADTGADLLTVLARPWAAEGTGPFPIPFAFHSGIFVPVMMALGASGALPFVAVLLLFLLGGRGKITLGGGLVLALILANLALSAEHLFVFLWAGVALAVLVGSIRARRITTNHWTWAGVLLVAGVLSVVQGAFITEAMRNILLRLQGITSTTGGSYNYFEFTPRWPPVLVSAHFGDLTLLDPRQLVVALAELGPALLLAPAATLLAWRRLKRGDWLYAGLAAAALVSIFIATFFRYGVERSSTRLPAASLWIWALLAFPAAWVVFRRAGPYLRAVLSSGYAAAVFAGVILFAVQLTTLPAPQISYYIDGYDANLSGQLWNRLPEGAEVYDSVPERSVALFGRPSRAKLDFYHPLPEWGALYDNPSPAAVAQAGYRYIYIHSDWWFELKPEQQATFHEACVKVVASQEVEETDFRRLLDVSDCR